MWLWNSSGGYLNERTNEELFPELHPHTCDQNVFIALHGKYSLVELFMVGDASPCRYFRKTFWQVQSGAKVERRSTPHWGGIVIFDRIKPQL